MTDERTLDRYVAEALAYDVPAEVDYRELCKENYPDDLFMMEGVEGKYAQEERYGVIVAMEAGVKKNG